MGREIIDERFGNHESRSSCRRRLALFGSGTVGLTDLDLDNLRIEHAFNRNLWQ